MDTINLRGYEHLSPFEIKDELIRLARTSGQATAHVLLNAGRGNPNWIATHAREAFFLLGQFAISEAASVKAHPSGIAGMPRAAGIADRLDNWLGEHDAAGVMALIRGAVEGLGLEAKPEPLFDNYYGLINLEFWLHKYLGEDVARFIQQHVHPLDIVFREHGIVLLNGGGFHAPDWSVRVSFANLEDEVYDDIGRAIRSIAQDYVHAYRAAQQEGSTPAVPEPAWPREAMQ